MLWIRIRLIHMVLNIWNFIVYEEFFLSDLKNLNEYGKEFNNDKVLLIRSTFVQRYLKSSDYFNKFKLT
ncbi:unnamed protein product [Blepharisma stoltei]|uniref:Uncharacterized protein n=1 Tax=Blepharisma stoltei TaxID=1481888 RepID=A0AAU9J0W6_9CILI|nr:unnamed protein product [Blepharisma stoltei]